MLIFLYGPDTYRSQLKLKEIIENYRKVHKSGLNLKYFNNSNLNFQDLKDELRQSSMFQEKKLIVLTSAFSNSDFKKKFLKEVKPPTKFLERVEDILLFYEREKISARDSLFIFLKKYAKSQEFKILEDRKLNSWAEKEFKTFEADIEREALDKLVAFVGNNLWQMTNEIRKLVSFKDGQTIKVKDVELLVKPKIESDIFKTIDAIASKNKKGAIKLLKAHLKKGDTPLYLFSMINFQFRNLLIIKDLIEKNLSPFTSSMHPYVAKKSCELSTRFELKELKKIYQKIFKADYKIKTGKIKPETALDLLIAEI